MAVTNLGYAEAVLKAIPRIAAAVLPYGHDRVGAAVSGKRMVEQQETRQGSLDLSRSGKRHTILIVTNEWDVGRDLRNSLERQAHRLVVVPNGTQAVDQFREIHDSVAIVVLDSEMQLAEMIDALQEVDESCPLVVCANAENGHLPRPRGKIAAVLHKPIDQHVADFAIRTLINRLGREAP